MSRRSRFRTSSRHGNWTAGGTFAICRLSPSTAKRRAISTMRFLWTSCRTVHYALQVHIADVSHYVKPGSTIDTEARLRGTSVYFPDRAVPMLPFELSTNICSLVPHKDRLVMSALIELDRQGEPVKYEFCRGGDSQRGTDDVYECPAAARGRHSATRALCPPGGALRTHCGNWRTF